MNQRDLIDKLLTRYESANVSVTIVLMFYNLLLQIMLWMDRYSTQLAEFRELTQNGDDAGATLVVFQFGVTKMYVMICFVLFAPIFVVVLCSFVHSTGRPRQQQGTLSRT